MSRLSKFPYLSHRISKVFLNIAQRREFSKKTMKNEALRCDVLKIFGSGVNSVKPNNLISSSVQMKGSTLFVNGQKHKLAEKIYVVGFGKAVAGMAGALERILDSKIISGVISVPAGTSEIFKTTKQLDLLPHAGGTIKVLEGARNNLPDEDSLTATKEIVELISKRKKEDLLIVLISGGGSALLTLPKPPLHLTEKREIIQLLSNHGATIQELNCVRKRLSLVKGGGLAQMTYPCQVITLILSDIIGNPLDLIASSPTVENKDDPEAPLRILKKYLNPKDISPNVMSCLQKSETSFHFENVINYLIGTNQKALQSAKTCAEKLGYITFILTDTLQGEAAIIGQCFAKLAKEILDSDHSDTTFTENTECLKNIFGESLSNLSDVTKNASIAIKSGKPVCILTGGESTVVVTGNGIGGRNQEMSLSFAVESDNLEAPNASVFFLSAGTDGIDGPTDAAGALAYPKLASEARKENLDPKLFLLDNNSYSFYKAFASGKDHVVIGHSGTNVMDIQILLIHPKLQ